MEISKELRNEIRRFLPRGSIREIADNLGVYPQYVTNALGGKYVPRQQRAIIIKALLAKAAQVKKEDAAHEMEITAQLDALCKDTAKVEEGEGK